jgi:hypothetical protein
MKQNLGSNFLLTVACAALSYAFAQNAPGGEPWSAFLKEAAPWWVKARFLASAYGWPALLSFAAIMLFQLQVRLSASGANRRTVFAVCALASGAMVLGLRELSFSPHAAPSYVLGVALAYTVMSRLYAVRMRRFYWGVRAPWPVWRGNRAAVEAIDRELRARMQGSQPPALS